MKNTPRFVIEKDQYGDGHWVRIDLGAYSSQHYVKTRKAGEAFILRVVKQAIQDWGASK